MINLVLSEVIEAIEGRCCGQASPVSVTGVSIDSRSCRGCDVFFAIRGERYDGHDFVRDALGKGAVAAVIRAEDGPRVAAALEQGSNGRGAERLIEVGDPLEALGKLAAYHRKQLSANVIAVVGSNGKTTTKAMIDHLLCGRFRGRCAPKSFNNSVGVPLTLLDGEAADEYLVVEIGTNAPGEVAALAAIAEPSTAVITCIGPEHLEGLGDLDGVVREETSVLQAVRPGGFAAVNIDAPEVQSCLPTNGPTLTSFGYNSDADVRLSDVRYEPPWTRFLLNGRFEYRLGVIGAHNAVNATAAIVVARRFGLEHEEIAERLERFSLPPMRNEIDRIGGITIINDAYNSNPQSAVAALEVLESIPARGRRMIVFGEMRELGRHSPRLHADFARRMAEHDIDRVILVGPAGDLMYDAMIGSGMPTLCVERRATVEECGDYLAEELRDGDVVLLKASRAVGLERLLEPIRKRFEAVAMA
ncbi:MAG: UDP-N-acetylmuramoyl-tripeptide--D-alanyl-D-alanine ligase [Planctomycetes bacterium]|nr:UDP-N-acetylmuramoyl-tripeptide--D-alanyl-D-alanine ligase [Planctomycetota bacterium]